jgi:hypothetical protein
MEFLRVALIGEAEMGVSGLGLDADYGGDGKDIFKFFRVGFVLSHPSDRNEYVARVGHPEFVLRMKKSV